MKYTQAAVMNEKAPQMKPYGCQHHAGVLWGMVDTYDLSTEVSVTFVLDVRRHGRDKQRNAEAKEARDGLHLFPVP